MTWNHILSTTARGYGARWQRTREWILKRDSYLCQCPECERLNRVRFANEVDHVVPRSRGGTDDERNLQAISSECHKLKTMRENGGTPRPRIGLDGLPID